MEIFEMQKEFDELMKKGQELIEKMKKEQSKKVERWKPKEDDIFYYIADNGCVMSLKTDDYISDYVENLYDFYNIFKTEQEAKKELDRRVAESELLDIADGSLNNNEWFEIEYDPNKSCFVIGCYGTITSSCYRFASKETARKAIKQLGEERLKLIFRID